MKTCKISHITNNNVSNSMILMESPAFAKTKSSGCVMLLGYI